MTALFAYPPHASFARVLPKNKIYQRAQPNATVKDLFVHQVEQIVRQYQLSPETINVQGTKSLAAIQVFHIMLKNGELKQEVLRCIDQAIPVPIIFELYYEEKVKAIAAYKRTNDADAAKSVISQYYSTDWVQEDAPRQPLPVVFDLENLYAQLLAPLLPYPARQGESLQEQVNRMQQIEQLQRDLKRCENRLNKEKQFNRKVEINAEMREMRKRLEELKLLPTID